RRFSIAGNADNNTMISGNGNEAKDAGDLNAGDITAENVVNGAQINNTGGEAN
ncbi:MAG: hypothetical protein GY761_17190, partial [Hyphomicrobiales bacterium]|nr:hypothetical protein [Hyphomicrobiales bacterium]